jgi:putative transposase
MKTFLCEEDYGVYMGLMKDWCGKCQVEIQAYCLMPNHVHLIAVPETLDGLARAIGEAHRRYTRHINFREGWRGYLWQGRFGSVVMDQAHFLTAMRYVELNPVRARLAERPGDWPWCSARAHLTGAVDPLVGEVGPMIDYIGDWAGYLALDVEEEERLRIQKHTRTGRPLGDAKFARKLEAILGRRIRKGRPGRKPSANNGI